MPGDRCTYHTHRYPYMFYNLTSNEMQELDADGKLALNKVVNVQKKGDIKLITREMGLGSHAVRNVGSTKFRQFIVEFRYL